MLYAHGGPHKIHGDNFDYIVIEENQVKDAIEKGWRLTTPEAIAFASEDQSPEEKPKRKRRTKAEMAAEAKE